MVTSLLSCKICGEDGVLVISGKTGKEYTFVGFRPTPVLEEDFEYLLSKHKILNTCCSGKIKIFYFEKIEKG